MQEITLANYQSKTAQEIYDYVARHLLTQNAKALGPNPQTFEAQDTVPICVYLTKDGKRCAAGCLIAPHEYCNVMEGKSWDGLIANSFITEGPHDVLIRDLQYVHDSKDTHQWEAALEFLAIEKGLTPFKLERKA